MPARPLAIGFAWALVAALPASGAAPDFPFSIDTPADFYTLYYTDEGSHAIPEWQVQWGADAIRRGGVTALGNPRGHHPGFTSLGFLSPFFDFPGLERPIYFWDCAPPEPSDCDNGQAPVSQIRMPTSVYSSLQDPGGNATAELALRMVLGHELFHHVEFAYVSQAGGSGCGPWPAAACEGHARMMQDHIYDDIDLAPSHWIWAQGSFNHYLEWSNTTIWEYSYDSSLFWHYLAQRLGDEQDEPTAGADFIVQWWENAVLDYDTPDIIDVTRETIEDFSPSDELESLFFDMAIANAAKDYDLSELSASNQSRWSYADEGQGFAQPDYASVTIFFDPVVAPGSPGPQTQGLAHSWATNYQQADVSACPAGSVLRYEVEQIENGGLLGLLAIRGGQVLDVVKHAGSDWNIALVSPNPRYTRLISPVSGLSDEFRYRYQVSCFDEPEVEFPLLMTPDHTGGGPIDDFGAIPVDVDVEGEDLPLRGLGTDAFEVYVGAVDPAHRAPVRAAFETPQGYRLLIAAPPGLAPGSHDLIVRVGAGQVAAGSAFRRGARAPDQLLLLDRSQSMASAAGSVTRLSALQSAASLFADSVPAAGRLGLVSFAGDGVEPNDDADEELALAPVGDAQRTAMRAAIAALPAPSGPTSIGDGLAAGARALLADGDAVQENHALLVSDGAEGEAQTWATARSAVRSSGTRVHAIALGPDADQGLLGEIAAETGGGYDYVPLTPTSSLRNRLADALLRVADRVARRQRLWRVDGRLSASSPSAQYTLPIAEQGLVEAVIAVHWSDPGESLAVTVTRPDSSVVTNGVAGARVFASGTHHVVQLPSLGPGTWQIDFDATGGSPVFAAMASARSPSGAYVITQVRHVHREVDVGRTGGFAAQLPVAISTALVDAAGPLLGADVEIEVHHALPEVDDEVLVGFDHGALDDEREGDGVYTARYRATTAASATGLPETLPGAPGSYRIEVSATGMDSGGHPFTRLAELSFWVGPGSDATDGDGDGVLDRLEEKLVCLSPGVDDTGADFDGDGIPNGGEIDAGTDPCRSDGDGGGEHDGSERARGANPFDPSDDALPAPGFFEVVSRVLEHAPDDPRFVPQPLAILLRFPSHPSYAEVAIERRSVAPGAVWLEVARFDPRDFGGAWADAGLGAGARFEYRMRGIDGDGNESALSRVVEGTAKLDPVAPIGAVRVLGPPRRDDPAVVIAPTIYREGTAGIQMQVWASGESEPTVWTAFQPFVTRTLAPVTAPATRLVFARFRDAAGNESLAYHDTLELHPPDTLGAIEGTAAVQGRPAAGVRVLLAGAPWEPPVLSDDEGRFVLPALAAGTYELRLDAGGSATDVPGIVVGAGAETDVGVVAVPEPTAGAVGAAALAALAAYARARRHREGFEHADVPAR